MDFGKEAHRGKMPFSVYPLKGTLCQHDSSLLVLTLITWLRQCLSGLLLKLLFAPLLQIVPLEESQFVQSHLRYGEFCSISLRAEYLRKLFGILLPGRFVFSPTSIYSIIYLYQYGLKDIYFVLWVIILPALYLLHCSNCSIFSHWKLFQLPSVCLWHSLSSCAFLEVLPYFLALRDTTESLVYFLI